MTIDNTTEPRRDSDTVHELVGRLQYRPWNDRSIRWEHENKGTDAERWCAYYNGDSIGAVCLGKSKHWDGLYAFMHGSRFGVFPETVEEGKRWMETLFWAWIKRAAEDIPANTERSGASSAGASCSPAPQANP